MRGVKFVRADGYLASFCSRCFACRQTAAVVHSSLFVRDGIETVAAGLAKIGASPSECCRVVSLAGREVFKMLCGSGYLDPLQPRLFE